MYAHRTLQVIHDEHGTLSAVLRSILLLLAEQRRHSAPMNFPALRAMLFYIDAFPERMHHPKESELLFPRVRARCPDAAATLDRLDADHARSHAEVLDLEYQLLDLEMMGDAGDAGGRRQRFEEALHAYAMGYLDHMRIEETEVLPAAERVLTDAEWVDLDAAFAGNRDPLLTDEADAYRPLFKRILMTLPAPLGLGPSMEAMRGTQAGRVDRPR